MWAYEIIANEWNVNVPGFNFGIALEVATVVHELGQLPIEWAYKGINGNLFANNVSTPFGRPVGNVGDRILLKYDGSAGTLSFYTKLVGEETWTLEGERVAFTDIDPPEGPEGKQIWPITSVACFGLCTLKLIPPGPDAP